MTPEDAAALRAEFPPAAVGKLPKGGAMLDYVGHAAVTDRLLQVDREWSWEPVAYAADGAPLVRLGGKDAELWIRLTVCGVTRLGVGTAAAGSFDLPKQLVSDAIRNAAMRFGVALDLWSKEDLHDTTHPPEKVPVVPTSVAEELADAINALGRPGRKAWLDRFRVPPAELSLELLPDARTFLQERKAEAEAGAS